jgi:formyltetrahydrofolate synthetase
MLSPALYRVIYCLSDRSPHPADSTHLYDQTWPIKRKIETIAMKMYGAGGVAFEKTTEEQMALIECV